MLNIYVVESDALGYFLPQTLRTDGPEWNCILLRLSIFGTCVTALFPHFALKRGSSDCSALMMSTNGRFLLISSGNSGVSC